MRPPPATSVIRRLTGCSSHSTPRGSEQSPANSKSGGGIIELRFLGKDATNDQSPTLYDTDESYNGKEVYVIQGWKVADAETLAQLDMPEHEAAIIVPKALMKYLPKATDGADTDQP